MAVTLLATARLNTGPYMRGLKQIAAGTSALSTTQVQAAAKEAAANTTRIRSTQALGRAHVLNTIEQNKSVAATNAATSANMRHNASLQTSNAMLSSQRYLYRDMSHFMMESAQTMALLPIAAIAAGTAYEKNFAEVVRTSDQWVRNSEASIESMRLELLHLVDTMPISWSAVTEIASLANQMGIGRDQTLEFTRAVAQFSATSDVSVETAATAFGRLSSIVDITDIGFVGLADSILKVGVNSVATEGEIINIVTQVSSIAGAAGFTAQEMVGLAGAMASVRVPPELARGVVTRVFGQISRAASKGGAALEGVASIAGMTSEEFRDSWGSEGRAGEAFLSFVNGLQKLGPMAEAELRGLGITSVRDVPVMLRLAGARDSEGNIGGLLRQTFDDAMNAANEMDKQYGIVAETVAAKLVKLGNSILGFFAAIGGQSLDTFGSWVDAITSKIQNLTDSLSKPFKILGMDIGKTNGDVLAMVATLALATAGFLALGSVVTRVMHGITGFRQAWGMLTGSSFMRAVNAPNQIMQSWSRLPGQLGGVMAVTSNAVRRGYSDMTRGARGFYTGMLAPMKRYEGALAGQRTMFMSNVQAFERGSARAQGAVVGFTNKAIGAVKGFGGFMGRLAGGLFGPIGLGLSLVTMGVTSFIDSTKAAGTEVNHLVEDLQRGFDNAKKGMTFEDIEVGKIFNQIVKPFEDGFRSIQAVYDNWGNKQDVLQDKLDSGRISMGEYQTEMENLMSGKNTDLDGLSAAFEKINDTYVELTRSGHGEQFLALLAEQTQSAEELMNILNQEENPDLLRGFKAAFDELNLAWTAENIEKFMNGQLPELSNKLKGLSGDALEAANAIGEIDSEATQAFTDLLKQAEDVEKAFIDFGGAIQAASDDVGNFSLSAFTDELMAQNQAIQDFFSNASQLGIIFGEEVYKGLLEMGPEGAIVAQEMMNHVRDGAVGEAQRTADAIAMSITQGVGADATSYMAAGNKIAAALGDGVRTTLATELSTGQTIAVAKAMDVLGKDAIGSFISAIEAEGANVEAAFGRLMVEHEVEIGVAANIDPALLTIDTLEAIANNTTLIPTLDALSDPANNKIAQVIELADGSTGIVTVDADTGLAEDGIVYVVDAAGQAVGVITLDGDNAPASRTLDEVVAAAAGANPVVSIFANVDNVWGAINSIAGASIPVSIVPGPIGAIGGILSGLGLANGGVIEKYAAGGVREKHTAQIAKAGAMRVWAEPETGGEAYIPLHPGKRNRSTAILDDVARRFGYSLTRGNDTARFANGGTYQAQQVSRSLTNNMGVQRVEVVYPIDLGYRTIEQIKPQPVTFADNAIASAVSRTNHRVTQNGRA